jgi:uncharacterized membrane protein
MALATPSISVRHWLHRVFLYGIDYTEYFCMELITPSIPVRIGYTEYFYTALVTSSISVRHWLHQVFLFGISYTEYFCSVLQKYSM